MTEGLPRVLLAGNPNTGKSTLFNRLTGGRARVGNYPGITVEPLRGQVRLPGGLAELHDLPGTYSLVAHSLEEELALDCLVGRNGQARADMALVCCDATNLLRNLYLVLQLQELGLDVVVALTMTDEAGDQLPDPAALGQALQCSVVPCVPRTGKGVEDVRELIEHTLENLGSAPTWRFEPGPALASALDELAPTLGDDRALALWALMSVGDNDELRGIPDTVRERIGALPESLADEAIQGRYAWLDAHIAPLIPGLASRARSERLDRVLLHPVFGMALFIGIMMFVFQGLFTWSDPFIGLIEDAFGALGGVVATALPTGLVSDFLVEGVIGGLGSVLVFLPQIGLLFLLVGVMEDSGYMARVAYLMDRVMKPLGLHGRAFVPMLSGFACAVPAIAATRTMTRRRDRILTMMVVPLMTCAARLPVYSLVIAALFSPKPVLGIFTNQGFMMTAMYLFSVVIALAAGLVMSKTLLKASPAPLLLELPPYRLPRVPDVLRQVGRQTKHYLKDAGTIIFGCTIGMWLLLTFPRAEPIETPSGTITAIEQSWAGQLGHAIEPAIEPLGFDWKIGVGLVGAFAAREVFVGTMGVVYAIEDLDEDDPSPLRERMRLEIGTDGAAVWTPRVGLSLMVFIALACQCMSTLAAAKRETKSWRWPAFLFGYMTALAWIFSFVTYQGLGLLGLD
ncbi:MAG: ferrous iron transport protein B [Proteobacteria bacterium]|nr:ferrous iron transport protein B [Pseudomonadota bacterium]MCP4916815.1 ferrous iron transport protein B [Pseudomonadota bacterium]